MRNKKWYQSQTKIAGILLGLAQIAKLFPAALPYIPIVEAVAAVLGANGVRNAIGGVGGVGGANKH